MNDNMIHAYVPRSTSSGAASSDQTSNIPNSFVSQIPMHFGPVPVSSFPYVQRFREITKEMADLYAKKNADYGNSFAKSIEEFGLVAGLVRLSDKWNRVCELVKKNGEHLVANESLKDTAIDGACYFIMLAMEIERLSHPDAHIGAIEFGKIATNPADVILNPNDSITRSPQITC